MQQIIIILWDAVVKLFISECVIEMRMGIRQKTKEIQRIEYCEVNVDLGKIIWILCSIEMSGSGYVFLLKMF